MDQDYLNKLSPKEKDWLNKFNREYVNGSLDSSNPKKNLHRTKKLIKDCYDRNNSRNRDILTREKASNHLIDYESLVEQPGKMDEEDHLIQKLDEKEIAAAVEWLADELDKDYVSLENKLINEYSEED